MEVGVKNINGDTVDTVNLDDAVFSVPMNHSLVHQALVIYQSNKRHGTHDTKTRAQVSGRRSQAVDSEAYRTRPAGQYPGAPMAARRRGFRPAPQELSQSTAPANAAVGIEMRFV